MPRDLRTGAALLGLLCAPVLCAPVLCALALAAPAGLAHAQDEEASQSLDDAARLTFQAGRQAFQAGDYDTALERFETAYRLSHRPGLLYNIGATYDRLRRDREALDAFERFLAAEPNAPNATEIRARMVVLRGAVEAEDRRIAEEQERQRREQQRQEEGGRFPFPILHQAILWTSLGLTAVAGGVLVWSGVDTLGLNDAYLATTDQTSAQAAYNVAIEAQDRTNILVGVTAGLAVLTGVFAIITDFGGGEESSSEGEGGSVTPTAAPTAAFGADGFHLGLSTSF